MFGPDICGHFKIMTIFKFILLLLLLLWSIDRIDSSSDYKLMSSNNNNNNTNYTNSFNSKAIGNLNSPTMNHMQNVTVTVLHEVHDGTYSMKKDRPDNVPLKTVKKKPYTLLDKANVPMNNYEKTKTLKQVEFINPIEFDFNLSDLEDVEHEPIKQEPLLNIANNNNNTNINNDLPPLYETVITNGNTKNDKRNEEDEISISTQSTNEHPSMTSTSSSVSYSYSSSVVTISPHIFKVMKNKFSKKGHELLKRDDLTKTLNNKHNSILHYFNENGNDVINENEDALGMMTSNDNITQSSSSHLHNVNVNVNVNVFHILINLYDHFYWQSSEIQTKVSTGCGLEMQAYLTGLHGNYNWAQKAYDASGHYRGQLFFGNDKWLGQRPFCYELNRQLETESRKHFEFEFYVALINLNLWLPEKLALNLQLGECLPKSCSVEDVQHILNIDPHVLMLKSLSAPNTTMNIASIKILRVRSVPGIYSYWRDLKFQLFLSFIVTLIVLVLTATWYQSKLNDRILYMTPNISIISQKIDRHLAEQINRSESHYSAGHKAISFELYQMSHLNETNNNSNNRNNPTSPTVINDDDNNGTNRKYPHGNANNNNNNDNNGHHNHHHLSTQYLTSNENTLMNEIEYKIDSSGHRSLSQGTFNIKQELGLHEQLLLCFAFQTNASNILSIDNSKELQTSCIHGLRVLSVLWTIMVHTYLQVFSIGENRFRRIIVERSPFYQIVGNATFSVDTFFFISGFLVTLLFLKLDKKYPEDTKQFFKTGIYDTIIMFMYRYIRLTPAYLFVILFNDLALRQTFDNSIFQPTVPTNTCHQFWWRNILYINNFYPLSEICMIWSWYMANEMQFYMMATILLILSLKYFKSVVVTIIAFLLSSWSIAGIISLQYHYTHKVSNPFESFDFLYDKPWQRVGTYLMGMLTGYIIKKTKKPPKISNRYNNLLLLSSIGLMTLIIFGVWRGQLDEITTSFYVSIGHTAFSLGLVWIVLSCCWGLSPTINRILSYRCLWPLSRLTYCAYLIHPVIMLITAFRMDGTVHLNNIFIMIIFLGNAVLSFIAAFFISVLMEAPVIRLLKIIFHK